VIESIDLSNVEPHLRLTVEFDAEATCLIGDTDAGKSATMRALLWALLNRPSGMGMITHGKKTGKAVVKVDGRKITRKRGKATNLYTLDGKKFKAFGTTVPPDVAKAARVDDVNFQQQMDGPFWFNDSPGKVSKELNRVVDLEEIDKVLSLARSEVRSTQGAVKVTRERLKSAKEELETLRWVPGFIKRLEDLRRRERDLVNKTDVVNRLHILVTDAFRCEARANRAAEYANQGKRLVARGNAIFALQDECDSLGALVSELEAKERSVKLYVPTLTGLETKARKLKTLEDETIALESLLTRIQAEEEICEQARRRSTAARKALEAEAGGRCPLCRSPLTS
jgi:DNA repair exonuclease SbcCD ATPase subunit